MKTAEELLKEKRITPETIHHNYAYVYRVACDLIGEAQKEAYNQALEDAAENVEVDTYELDPMGDNGFILQKTLRLPLYTRGLNLIIVGKVELNKDSILKLKK